MSCVRANNDRNTYENGYTLQHNTNGATVNYLSARVPKRYKPNYKYHMHLQNSLYSTQTHTKLNSIFSQIRHQIVKKRLEKSKNQIARNRRNERDENKKF